MTRGRANPNVASLQRFCGHVPRRHFGFALCVVEALDDSSASGLSLLGTKDVIQVVVRAIELGLRDRDDDVRDAATRSADLIEEALGWRISRPVV